MMPVTCTAMWLNHLYELYEEQILDTTLRGIDGDT